MDPNQMLPRSFPMWPPSDAAPPQPFLPPPNANRGWKRKNNPGGYQPPDIADLQVQNRAKARRWFKNPNPNNNNKSRKYLFPYHKPKAAAPRNTTSFIIRAKRAGGIASLVSPCPVTPAVLPTPRLSPTREGLSDMAQQQWGVDGYGSMKGLIRLRSSPQPPNAISDDDDDEENSSGSDVEEHVEVERRLDHDLSRFEMVYPGRGDDVFEEDEEHDQDVHVARLEEENLTLKERLFLMEQEVGDMRRRLEVLEARFSADDAVCGGGENALVNDGTDRDNVAATAAAGTEIDTGVNDGTDRDNVTATAAAGTEIDTGIDDGTDRDSVTATAAAGTEINIGMDDGTDRDNVAATAAAGIEIGIGMDDGTDRDNVAATAAAGTEINIGMDDGTDRDNVAATAAAGIEIDIGMDDGTHRDNVAAAAAGTENDIGMDAAV